MKTNLLSKTTPLFLRLLNAFFLISFLMLGVKTFGQYSGTGTFTKVTSAADVTDGYYVIAYGTTQAMNSTYTSSTYFANTAISPTSGTTITNPSKAIVWKIETSGTGKSISSADTSVFASYTGSSNNIQAVTSVSGNNQRWSFSYTGGVFEVQNLGVTTRYLQYNTASPRFACYTGSQQDITLYKLASTPTLTVTPASITGLSYVQGAGPSTSQAYNLKGADLTAGVTVTAPTNFEVSKTSGGTYAASITYTAAEGNATSGQTVYVRLKSGLTANSYSGSVTNASTGATGKNVSVAGSVSVPVAYTLTYNGNDNTSNPDTVPGSVSFTGGQNTGVLLANPATLVKEGYDLASWYSIANGVSGGVSNTPGSNYGPAPMPSADITIFARWRFMVAYNSNGGSGSVSGQTAYYNGTAGVKSGTVIVSSGAALTRSGYTFGGWMTSANGTAANYIAGDTYTHTGSSSTRTLYAYWIPNPPKLTVAPGALSGFTYSESNGPSSVQSFVLSGSDLQGTDTDPVELVTINDRFEISEAAAGPWSHAIVLPSTYTGANKTIYVRLKAGLTANANYTDTVLVSGGSAVEANFAEVNLSGSVSLCLAPTAQSSVSSFGSVTSSGMTVNLTTGNGVGRIVKINTSNSFTDPVSSNVLPVADAAYSGNGEQVVFAGSGSSVVVTGLLPSTTYHYRVYEYNICSGNYTYATGTVTNNPRSQATLCQIPTVPNGEITPSENPACSSASLIYELGTQDAANITAGATYYWQTTATGTSTVNPVVFTGSSQASEPYSVTLSGNYYVRAYNGFCWSNGSYVTQEPISISTTAGIATQPSNQNVVVGANASFTVAASGTAPFTYQWQESPTGLSGSWINVGTAATLNVNTVSLSKNGYKYRVIVSNGCGSVTSNVVTLSVVEGPCINEDFEGADAPVNWTFTGTVWGGQSCSGTDGIVFNGSGDLAITPVVTNPQTLSFSKRRSSNTTAWSMQVQVSTNAAYTTWTTIKTLTLTDISTTCSTELNIDLSAYTGSRKIRFLDNRTSGAHERTIDDVVIYCAPSCKPADITVFPVTGPPGTVVVINGSDFTSASEVHFGTTPVTTVEYISPTQLKAIVPSAASGNIIVNTALDCDSEAAFTLIKEDISNCEPMTGASPGGTYASDLIIYEIYDENGGTGGTVSIFNGTNAAVDLSNYDIYRAGNYGETYSDYATISGSLASGAVALIGTVSSNCGYISTNGTINGGFNDNDGFRLMKGSVVVDDVRTPNYSGYYMKRKNEYLAPNLTFNDTQWITESLSAGQCLPVDQVGRIPGIRTAPVVTAQPSYSILCDVVNASLTLTATEGLSGGNNLAYQWYVLGSSGSWTAITDGGVYLGAATPVLTISNTEGLNNNQYYCQVRENTQTCYTATNATQIKEAGNTWASNVWSNGTPVLGNKVIIAGTYDTQANGVLDVCDLTVNAGGSIRVKPNFPITVKKKIINNNANADSFVVESDANLIQTEDVSNEGNIKVERSVAGMNNGAGAIDYVYWSSPVSGQEIKGQTGFSPNTPATGYMQYNESNDKFVVTNDLTFLTGKGYAIRAENVLPNPYSKTYSFAGIPNNGDVSSPILNKSAGADKGYNLIGNPYPSNIDFDLFHSLNASKIYATAFFWTNNQYEPQQMGSGYSGNNYAIYNITGGVPATYDEGNTNYSVAPNGKIKVGQGFIVQSKIAGALDFKNGIRITDDGTFYQKSSTKNRFWLTMKSPNNLVNTILIGYVPGATNNYETDFDGELFAVGSDSFYSVLGAKKLAIQGRADNFYAEDVVALGNVFSMNGAYTIKLKTSEGNFNNNQTIYLRDRVLNKYINLSNAGSYTFEATKGTDNTRFEIVYKDATLTTNENNKSEFLVYKDGQDFVIRSSKKLGKIDVFDISGRLIKSFITNQITARLDMSTFSNGIFIIKAENSGDIRTKKINR